MTAGLPLKEAVADEHNLGYFFFLFIPVRAFFLLYCFRWSFPFFDLSHSVVLAVLGLCRMTQRLLSLMHWTDLVLIYPFE